MTPLAEWLKIQRESARIALDSAQARYDRYVKDNAEITNHLSGGNPSATTLSEYADWKAMQTKDEVA